MKAKGFNEASIAALWGVLVPFSDYAFNKAHTAAYGLVSYWTAYLKANYPAEYMAALLTSVGDDKDKSALYLGECRRMGIKVLPPDVNDSIGQFAAVGTDIRFGMQAIRNVGHNVVEAIIAAREEKGRFTSFRDFMSKVPGRRVQQAHHRVAHQGRRLRRARRDPDGPAARPRGVRRRVRRGQAPGGDRPGQPVRGVRRRLAAATSGGDLMGLTRRARRRVGQVDPARPSSARCSASTSPTTRCSASSTCSPPHADTPIAALTGDEAGKPEGSMVTVAGLITGLQVKRTKKGDLWAIATVEDLAGAIECLFFPSAYMTVGPMLQQDTVAVVRGKVNRRDDTVSIYAQELTLPDVSEGPRGPGRRDDGDRPRDGAAGRGAQGGAHQPPGHHRGAPAAGQARPVRARSASTPAYRVNATEALFGDLKVLLGPALPGLTGGPAGSRVTRRDASATRDAAGAPVTGR